jgi:hypothetical protein
LVPPDLLAAVYGQSSNYENDDAVVVFNSPHIINPCGQGYT